MEHHFDIEVAQKVGVEKAILLYNLDFWICKNKANDDHLYDGRDWTYNSGRAFAELFPYMKEKSIARWLRELERDGFLVSSQKYNQTSYNKTKWYSLTKKYYSVAQNERSSGQSGQSDTQDERSIRTDSNPDNKPDSRDHRTDVVGIQPQAKGQKPGSKVAAALSDNGELFEQFWTVYPRKIGRKKCQQIWDRLKPSAELTGQIVTAVRAYKRTDQWLKDNGSFIPHPSTFLNQARWEDELIAKPEPQREDPDWLPTEEEAEQLLRETGAYSEE